MKRLATGLSLCLIFLLAACEGDRPLPTAPDGPAAGQATNASAAAKGKGKGPKGPHKPGGGDVSVVLQPDVWNTNYSHSNGTVSALIRGKDLGEIETSTIVLVGDGGGAPVTPLRVQRSGKQIRAFFAKSDVIESLDTPTRGELHDVLIQFIQDGEEKSFTVTVRIVGPGGDDGDDDEDADLELQIQPDHWNTNWSHSAGTVSAKITGDDLGQIDLNSFELEGTDPAADPITALRAKRSGNHVRAWFAKSEAIATLDTPTAGEQHDIIIRFTGPDGVTELHDTIIVEGPGL